LRYVKAIAEMKIVADDKLVLLDETFGPHGQVQRVSGREISPGMLGDADVLLLRSVTAAGPELLAGSPVRFVGTATSGTDHLDVPWLESRGIYWASAPGCNADAAAQYSLALIWEACRRTGRDPRSQSVGIIGRGRVGGRLIKLLRALDIISVACDPPLALAGETDLVDLDQALQQDIVSLHVPLSRDGAHPTRGMLDTQRLARMRDGAILVNTARGEVVNGAALLIECQRRRLHAALDVWPGEPDVNLQLLRATVLASPHVAGYSVEGKRNGTMMVYQEFLRWLGEPEPVPADHARPDLIHRLSVQGDPLTQVLDTVCGVAEDDRVMRTQLLSADNVAAAFDRLRSTYRLRHDFGAWHIGNATPVSRPVLQALGFSTI
jgi:erythronate-4-phosphate dehydrogenase